MLPWLHNLRTGILNIIKFTTGKGGHLAHLLFLCDSDEVHSISRPFIVNCGVRGLRGQHVRTWMMFYFL